MKLTIDGVWRGDIMPPPELATKHMIHGGSFRHKITNDGSSAFPAEPRRYHLFVSYACPFAHRPLVVRALKGLDGIVPVSTLHPIWNTPDGWASGDTPLSTRTAVATVSASSMKRIGRPIPPTQGRSSFPS
jgi:glutathionyl-hydroquinone reductase